MKVRDYITRTSNQSVFVFFFFFHYKIKDKAQKAG